MPAMWSARGTLASLPALDHRANSPAPGNHGMVAITSSWQRVASAANCWRLNGAESGSAALGKILVIARTRSTSSPGSPLEVEHLVHAQELEDRQRLVARARDRDRAAAAAHPLVELDER